mgnify:CR=1 FL=1
MVFCMPARESGSSATDTAGGAASAILRSGTGVSVEGQAGVGWSARFTRCVWEVRGNQRCHPHARAHGKPQLCLDFGADPNLTPDPTPTRTCRPNPTCPKSIRGRPSLLLPTLSPPARTTRPLPLRSLAPPPPPPLLSSTTPASSGFGVAGSRNSTSNASSINANSISGGSGHNDTPTNHVTVGCGLRAVLPALTSYCREATRRALQAEASHNPRLVRVRSRVHGDLGVVAAVVARTCAW